MPADFPQHRRRTALLVVLAGVTAFSLQALLTPQLWDVVDNVMGDDGGSAGGGSGRQLSRVEEMEMEVHSHRILISTVEETLLKEDEELLAIPGEDSLSMSGNVKAATEPTAANITTHAQLIDANQPLPTYTIIDALESSSMFDYAFALLVYDPDDDTFYGLYNPKRHRWVTGCRKLLRSFKALAYFLRELFPERFQGKDSEELIIPVSSGDSPRVTSTCIDHFHGEDLSPLTSPGWQKIIAAGKGCRSHAPVLHFGSAFRQPYMFPNIIAMPMPVKDHLDSFEMWAKHKAISPALQAIGQTKFVPKWEDLIPQVVWRGTDFTYLTDVAPALEKARYNEQLINWPWSQNGEDQMTKKIGVGLTAHQFDRKTQRVGKRNPQRAEANERLRTKFSKAAAVESMNGKFGRLLPRWKAVVLTAEAEVDASARPDALPWANMKFAIYMHGGRRTPTRGAKEYKDWENIDFPATGEYMGLQTLAKYKYQIDLGGGGGTTWSGTVQKLAMPGLLFHHMTPTKDYIHDWMKPWVHYVPVSSDLHDLKQKFDWAESHPVQSKEMADEGTKLMRYLTSAEGFEEMFQQDMVEPLRRVIEAYQPISTIHAQTSWSTWREAIREIEGDDVLLPLIECKGSSSASCVQMLDNNHMKKISK